MTEAAFFLAHNFRPKRVGGTDEFLVAAEPISESEEGKKPPTRYYRAKENSYADWITDISGAEIMDEGRATRISGVCNSSIPKIPRIAKSDDEQQARARR